MRKPVLIACWPGIGNIGVLAVDTLRRQLKAEEIGEIEPWDFFYPRKVVIRTGVLEDVQFPACKFYHGKVADKDFLFFVGEEQPADCGGIYAEGVKAYQMANLVLDVAERFGCYRVYTSGAAVALTHHEMKPRVWAVTSDVQLNKKVKRNSNTILMSEIEGRDDQGSITGLNGLLLGLAKKRGFEAICLMGEIPDYLSRAPFPYPKASKAVLEILSAILGVEISYSVLDDMDSQMRVVVSDIYEKFPPDIKEKIEQRKSLVQARPEIITEEDGRWIKEHIDELFKKEGDGGRSS